MRRQPVGRLLKQLTDMINDYPNVVLSTKNMVFLKKPRSRFKQYACNAHALS